MSDRTRREFVTRFGVLATGSAVFGRALAAAVDEAPKVTTDAIRQAEWISGVTFTDADRELMRKDVEEALEGWAALRAVPVDNGVPPALRFGVLEGPAAAGAPGPAAPPEVPATPPVTAKEDLPWASIRALAATLRARKVSAVELAELALGRLAAHGPALACVVERTEAVARRQAAAADAALRTKGGAGTPLLGLPWGAKDLVSVDGTRTTWGSPLFKDQSRAGTATVARRLEAAGAVLAAKTSVGELAWGDVWFGGTTKNPWKAEQGSSGSSAGSASAVAAGLVPFAIGTETWGSIVSPASRCGCTGLRPTFGRVSRHGVMALSWSMDKVGVLARSAEDCGFVFAAIHGRDPLDDVSVDRPFPWSPGRGLAGLRIGVVTSLFAEDRTKNAKTPEERTKRSEEAAADQATLETLKRLGATLVPIELPKDPPVRPLATILTAEAATAFDDLVRTGRVKEMVRQTADAWPNVFRQGQLVPAVEYLRANRVRRLVMAATEDAIRGVDLYVAPSFGGDNLLRTNLTGHPALCLPNGFRSDGTPTSITFTGRLFGEAALLSAGEAFQAATDFHRRRPPGF